MQHPRNKHENMPPPHHHHPHHQYQNMRGTHTLGRLPSHNQSPTHIIGNNNNQNDHYYKEGNYNKIDYISGPNNGKYATLSKQCKTLEANDFY